MRIHIQYKSLYKETKDVSKVQKKTVGTTSCCPKIYKRCFKRKKKHTKEKEKNYKRKSLQKKNFNKRKHQGDKKCRPEKV